MNIKEVDHVNSYVVKIARDLLDTQVVSPRGQKTLEIEDAVMILNNPKNSVITLPARKLNLEYLAAELQWYKTGDLSPEFIKQFSSFWGKLEDENGKVNSNYGFFVFKQQINGMSQYDWVKNRLSLDPESRQAIINYNQIQHKDVNTRDFVCTIAQQFRISQGKLDSRVVMRSNDLIYGFSYDVPWFTDLQRQIAEDLKVPVGKYIHYAMSLHVYEKHWKMLENIADSFPYEIMID